MIRAALLWLVLALPVAAQDLPAPQHTSVNDFAHVLSNDDTRIIDQALIALHDQTGVEGTVVTMNSRAQYGGTDGLEPFATRLFNHWGVGDKDRDDGFMVLLLKNDRETRIELGAGYPRSFDPVSTRIIDRTMLPAFRAGDYSRGLREGTLATIDQIARVHAAGEHPQTAPVRAAPPPAPIITEEPEQSWAGYLFSKAILGFFLLAGGLIGLDMLRKIRGRNQCPSCGARDLITMETPVRDPGEDGGWSISQMSVRRSCPKCGWSEEHRVAQPQVVSYAATGAMIGARENALFIDRSSDRRNRGERSERRDRSDNDRGDFGGGSSSGGGGSGRW